jgi:hypothetical protein
MLVFVTRPATVDSLAVWLHVSKDGIVDGLASEKEGEGA